jgi:SAM-dependent methyltransferase
MHHPPASRPFDVAYEGTPSWETGRPQPAVERLLAGGALRGHVLDVGCGTGTHAVILAQAGSRVAGLDIAAAAVALARERAAGAEVDARFVVGDALALPSIADALGAPFDAILDIGLFHVLQPVDRGRYAAALAAAVHPGGRGFVVVWSDRNPFGIGPARVCRRDLRDAFRASTGWRVLSIEPEELETRLPGGRVHAWLAILHRR